MEAPKTHTGVLQGHLRQRTGNTGEEEGNTTTSNRVSLWGEVNIITGNRVSRGRKNNGRTGE